MLPFNRLRRLPRLAYLCIGLLAAGCSGGHGGDAPGDADARAQATTALVDQTLLENAAQNVIIPTYVALVARADELVQAVERLAPTPTAATLAAARTAWSESRRPWEQNEAFLFGPVETQSYDAAMDSWPLNLADLQAVLSTSVSITPGLVDSQPSTQRGFHALELLLFGEGGKKLATDFTARELNYVQALAANLKATASSLLASWQSTQDGHPPYAEVLSLAGSQTNRIYPSLSSAGEELVQGMIRILDEVADNKIAGPAGSRDPGKVESQFSYNSLKDFADNLRSVENLYLGCAPGRTATVSASFSDRVRARDQALDDRIRAQITAAIAAVLAIPEPFPLSLQDPKNDAAIAAAEAAIHELRDTLSAHLLALVRA